MIPIRWSAPLLVVALALAGGARAGDPPPKGLAYSTTWLGNSFGGGPRWVQNHVEGMHVAADGTVYLASGWDESGREFGIYRDGEVVGLCADTHGWGTGGGRAVVADAAHLYIGHFHGNEGGGLKGPEYPPAGRGWFGISRRTKDGAHDPFPGGRGRFKDMMVLHEAPEGAEAQVAGLAIDREGRLIVSDPFGRRILIVDPASMATIRSFPVDRPGSIVVGPDGDLRVVRPAAGAEAGRVERYSAGGDRRAPDVTFEAGARPGGIAFDGEGRLLVADDGPSQQVLVFESVDERPTLVRTIGTRGGMLAGPTPGLAGPLRFPGPVGVGVDARGIVYVGSETPAGGTVLRAFEPTGRMAWELLGLEFVDGADAAPGTDGADVYTTEGRYALDWSATGPGSQWRWRSQTLDPIRFPDDPRLHEGHHNLCAPVVREIGGRRFLVVRGMFQQAIAFYRLEGEIAVPSTIVAKHSIAADGWSPPGMPAKGRWIWRDLDGDGRFRAEEFAEADGVDEPESWAWSVDDRGDLWQGDQEGPTPIRHTPCLGLDPMGNPIFRRARSETMPMPAPLVHLLRIEYQAGADVMYLTGHTRDRPKTGDEWGQVGTEVVRIDGWARGNRSPRYRVALPYDPKSRATIKSFCVAGDRFFAVEGLTARVHVHDAATGAALGSMTPGPEVGGESGWVDFPDAIRAIRRRDGEYLVFVEEDAKGKVIVYRLAPARDATTPPGRGG